jgi:hypothetical protein
VARRRVELEEPEGRGRSLVVRGVLVVAIVVLGWLLFFRAPGPGTIPASALDVAERAGCGPLERPVLAEPSRDHVEPGEAVDYPDPPPAAGPHDPTPLTADPHVREQPVDVPRAVHNLEHAYVLIWYRPTAEGGLSSETIDALEGLATEEDRVIMAPSPDLPEGTALALVAWNTRWRCPAGIEAADASTIAAAFVEAYRGTTNAPEAPRGLLGPLFVG